MATVATIEILDPDGSWESVRAALEDLLSVSFDDEDGADIPGRNVEVEIDQPTDRSDTASLDVYAGQQTMFATEVLFNELAAATPWGLRLSDLGYATVKERPPLHTAA